MVKKIGIDKSMKTTFQTINVQHSVPTSELFKSIIFVYCV